MYKRQEFSQKVEPVQVGADIMMGSLIKNAGGGIAQSGGYIAGRHDLVELCAYRLTSPGTGRELGCSLGQNRALYMGLFHAPTVTGEAMNVSCFANALFEELGYQVYPAVDDTRADIISAICLQDKERLCAFCRGIQAGAPAVSYTHLDVYKRQIWLTVSRRVYSLRVWRVMTFSPVSYTHLDVYKRQFHYSVPPLPWVRWMTRSCSLGRIRARFSRSACSRSAGPATVAER